MKYEHVMVLNPYQSDTMASMGVFPPTGLEYIAASMKGLVGRISLVDLRQDRSFRNLEKLREFIRKDVDLLCIGIMWRSKFDKICDLIRTLPPEVTTVVGGQQATQDVEELFASCPNISMVVRGEGEEIIKQLVNGNPPSSIRGLSYRENGKVVHNQNAPMPDIAALAFPDRSMRRSEYYWVQNGVKLLSLSFDTILSTRGCPYSCKFCTFGMNPLGQKREYTERPLKSVIEELRTITADVVLFSDDNFFTNAKRSRELCRMIVENGIKKTFAVQARIEVTKSPELLDDAVKAGIKIMLVGIESPHDRILKQISKGFTQQEVRDAFKVFNRYPFYIHGYFIYGNIGETEEEMLYIAQFARELGLESISFQKLRIEKFSPLQKLVESTPGYHYDSIGGPVYSDTYDLAALKGIRNRIRRQFYTGAQIRRILHKFGRLGLVSKPDAARLVLNIPLLIYGLAARQVEKKLMRRPKK